LRKNVEQKLYIRAKSEGGIEQSKEIQMSHVSDVENAPYFQKGGLNEFSFFLESDGLTKSKQAFVYESTKAVTKYGSDIIFGFEYPIP
jgi:hypothetical protein